MDLSGQQRRKLKEALISAFPKPFLLRQMLSFYLNKKLDIIAGGNNLEEIVFNLIETAETENWVEDLIKAALQSNPRNAKLRAIANELLPESSPNPNPQPQPVPNPSLAPTPTLQTPINSLTIPRRMLLKLAGLGGLGLGTAFLIHKFFELFQTSEFKTVTVDARETITNRPNGEAKNFEENLGNGVTLEMVQIPGGSFTMGSPADEAQRDNNEGPQHRVTIPEFFMGRYALTQAQYKQVMGENPSGFKGENRPVERVSWNNAVEFCKKLSQITGRTYRLPSEAEWEYACRAETTTPFHFGETITTDLVNYKGNYSYGSAPKGVFRKQTTDVGNFVPNLFGLYQMHGNIWEWCLDTWHKNYQGAPSDGSACIGSKIENRYLNWKDLERLYNQLNKNDNKYRMLRGGSWGSYPSNCRSAKRAKNCPECKRDLYGFRVVRDI